MDFMTINNLEKVKFWKGKIPPKKIKRERQTISNQNEIVFPKKEWV